MASSTYLTFNPSNKDGAQLDEICDEHTSILSSSSSSSSANFDISTALPLQYCWHIWEQVVNDTKNQSTQNDYSENTKALAKFDTVQKFWQLWYHMPQPSELLNQKRMVRECQDGVRHDVDALMIFREGIKPMWEDPCNCNGGHFEYRLRQGHLISGSQIDEYWNNLVLGLVGSTIDNCHLITGVRLVDKLSNTRGGCIRIEVWFSACDSERTIDELWKSVDKCMATKLDGTAGVAPKSDKKMHSTHK